MFPRRTITQLLKYYPGHAIQPREGKERGTVVDHSIIVQVTQQPQHRRDRPLEITTATQYDARSTPRELTLSTPGHRCSFTRDFDDFPHL